ncbi:MAG: hypothetical protein Q7J25_10265 [Vicinamibacterales bacterium]|nr:hypothetical protein [Vicinamibacterales bacterium]
MKPIRFPKWFENYAHHMLAWLVVVMLVGSQCGCAVAKIGALSTLASVADGRGTVAVVMMKSDKIEQSNFRKRSHEVKNLEDLNKLEAEFTIYTQGRDKGLLALDAIGDVINTARKMIDAGKYDLSVLLSAYADLKTLMAKLNIKLPEGL